MFPDFSQFGKSIDTLSEKFDRIIQLLESIEKNTTPNTPKAECHSDIFNPFPMM